MTLFEVLNKWEANAAIQVGDHLNLIGFKNLRFDQRAAFVAPIGTASFFCSGIQRRQKKIQWIAGKSS